MLISCCLSLATTNVRYFQRYFQDHRSLIDPLKTSVLSYTLLCSNSIQYSNNMKSIMSKCFTVQCARWQAPIDPHERCHDPAGKKNLKRNLAEELEPGLTAMHLLQAALKSISLRTDQGNGANHSP